jgi:hypothetical protein
MVAKSSLAGVGVDGLACPMHQPTTYSHQMRGQGFLLDVALSHQVAMCRGTLLGDTEPPGLDSHKGA